MNIAIGDIPTRLPISLVHKVAIVLGVHGLVNVTIVDLVHSFDEDILRYKNATKGIFVPAKYMTPTPAVDQVDRGQLAMAPESVKESVATVTNHTVESNATNTAEPIVVENTAEPIQPVANNTNNQVAKQTAARNDDFDEWADDDVPPPLRPSTGRAKSSSTEESDGDE